MFNFSGSDRSVGQSDCLMQIYTNTLSNEIAFVIQHGRTHGYVNPLTDGGSVNPCGDSPPHQVGTHLLPMWGLTPSPHHVGTHPLTMWGLTPSPSPRRWLINDICSALAVCAWCMVLDETRCTHTHTNASTQAQTHADLYFVFCWPVAQAHKQ